MNRLLLAGLLILALRSPLKAADLAQPSYAPKISPASDEGQRAMGKFKLAQGFNVSLFAAEPMLANPVSLYIDNQGKIYVTETFRLTVGVTDVRAHMDWLDDDIASQTVADREALLKKHLGNKFDTFKVEQDRVRVLEDKKGTGKADTSTVFADGFQTPVTGIGSGVLVHRGEVFYACIPDLWKLRDTKGTGVADERKQLASGFGVHICFSGHDLHGLRMGPDGKLYFSLGDRGCVVKTQEGKTIDSHDCGGVFRCDLDGKNLEQIALGLRNPQELAFDDYGNLFTCDNNSDGGDLSRWVQIVEGGEYGWRYGYQHLPGPPRGVWNEEVYFGTPQKNTAAYIIPAIINYVDGPAGLTHYPGTGWGDRYKDHFFLCDFRGAPDTSRVVSFGVRPNPKGAGWVVYDEHDLVKGFQASDCDFGPDSAMYLTDWVQGWGTTGKGRIYKIAPQDLAEQEKVKEVKKLLNEGMESRSAEDLKKLLWNADQRVRLEAQWELGNRAKANNKEGKAALAALISVTEKNNDGLARIHGLWALGMTGLTTKAAQDRILTELETAEPLVREQAAKVAGNCKLESAASLLVKGLKDVDPRVRCQAAIALGKLQKVEAVPGLIEMLRQNTDDDAIVRHSAMMGLLGCADEAALLKAGEDSSAAVRMGVALALRRKESPAVARFLKDADPKIVLEAARAISDVPIPAAFTELVKLTADPSLSKPVMRRAINAAFRHGESADAEALAKMAGDDRYENRVRIEALGALSDWPTPSARDRVVGVWRPLPARDPSAVKSPLKNALTSLQKEGTADVVFVAALQAIAKLKLSELDGDMASIVVEQLNRSGGVRAEALTTLDALQSPKAQAVAEKAVLDKDAKVRAAGTKLLAKSRPDAAFLVIQKVLASGTMPERQAALMTLSDMKLPAVEKLLSDTLDELLAGKTPPEMQLDLLTAAAARKSKALQAKLDQFESQRSKDSAIAKYVECLQGGDAERGRLVFYQKTETQCLRCHKMDQTGSTVGPELSKIGAQKNRQYLLEAVVDPNLAIAQGFESAVIITDRGRVYSGIVKKEDDKELVLAPPEGDPVTIQKSEIDERTHGISAMPQDLVKQLSKQELRDLVEFLSTRK